MSDLVLRRCRELGFALAGICAARPSRWGAELWEWLAQGRHGEMQYLANHAALRIDPAKFLPGARSIVCVADRYWVEKSTSQNVETSKGDGGAPDGNPVPGAKSDLVGVGTVGGSTHPSPRRVCDLAPSLEGRGDARGKSPDRARGKIARYARGDDYHLVMRKRLRVLRDELAAMFPEAEFRVCVDTAPVLEREHAARAGLGAVGKHTLLIEPGIGSYLLLGEIVTTLELAPVEKVSDTFFDPCGPCTRCIDACPTGAISPWSVDATKCISYLTIEHRSEIDPRLHEAMGEWLFGCDVCQEVCPHNQPTRRSQEASVHEAYEPRGELNQGLLLLTVLSWSEEDRQRVFAESAMKRAKLAMMKRNAIIVAGNSLAPQGEGESFRRIGEIAADEREDPTVRATAHQVLRRLKP